MLAFMKSKSDLNLFQKPVATAPSQAPTPDELDSPPYSPTPSCMERPVLEKHLEDALKESCAILVNETNPPSDDFEEVPDQKEALRRHLEERDATAKRHAREVKEKRHNEFRRPKTEHSNYEPSPYKHVPKTAAADFEKNAKAKKHERREKEPVSVDPVQPYHLEQKALANPDPDDRTSQIRAALDSRPKTSAAACVDYPVSSNIQQSGTSTGRTTTTFDSQHFRTTSTAGTSLAITPNDEKRSPYGSQRVSNPLQHVVPEEASQAEAAAKIWMQQELARRRAEKKAGPARPGSRASAKVASDYADRPVSRTGSIAESLRDGIRDYIRPRSSHDSIRSFGGSDLSRSHSGSSSIKGRHPSKGSVSGGDGGTGWFKGVRRRGSFSSWRNSKPVEGEPETAPGTSSGPAGQPNLNRELPPLPSLDQYKEQKPKPVHIASVMRPVSKPKKSPQPNAQQQQQQFTLQHPNGHPCAQTQTPPAMMLPALRDQYFAQSPTAFQRVGSPPTQQSPFRSPRLSPEQEAQRQAEVRAAIEEKMRLGATMASRGSGYYNPAPIVKPPYEVITTPGSSSLSPNIAPSENMRIPSPRSAKEMHGYGNHGGQPRSSLGMPVGPEGDVMRARSEPVIRIGKGVKTVTVVEPPKKQKEGLDKGKGLRKRLSRFWSHSGAKPVAAN